MEEWINQYWWSFLFLIVWELGWKGWALWKAAHNDEKAWFIVLLLINTLGILPIAYIFIFGEHKNKSKQT